MKEPKQHKWIGNPQFETQLFIAIGKVRGFPSRAPGSPPFSTRDTQSDSSIFYFRQVILVCVSTAPDSYRVRVGTGLAFHRKAYFSGGEVGELWGVPCGWPQQL